MTSPTHKRRLPRAAKFGIWFVALIAVYTLLGFLAVPAIIKAQMLKRLPPLTQRRAAIRQVAFNPYTLALTMRGLALTETNGDSFAGFDELHFQFQAMSSLFDHAWIFKDVTLHHPYAQLTRFQNRQFNFDNLSQTNTAPGNAALPAFLVESLTVDAASLSVDDLANATAFHDKVAPIYLQLTNLASKPDAATPYTVSATTGFGETFAVSGDVTIQPLHLSGSVKINGIDLKSYGPYLAAFTTAEILDGKLAADADYRINTALDVTVTNANAKLTGLRVKAPDAAEPILSIPSLTVESADATLSARRAKVRSVKSTGGSLAARRNHDGTISLLALLKNAPPAENAAPNQPWSVLVDEIAFDNYAVQIEDRSPAQPVNLALRDLAFKINGFTTSTNSPISASVSTRLNGKGTVAVSGTITLSPVSADLKLDVAGLELPAFQPYVAEQLKLALTAGQADLHGHAHYMEGPRHPLASFTGDFALTNIATADAVHYRELGKIGGLAVSGINFDFQPDKLHIDEVKLAGLHAVVVLDTNRQPNFLSIFPPKTAAPATTPAPMLPASLGSLVLDNASLHIVDESVQPNCVFDVQEFGGTIKGISSSSHGPSAVDLRGKVDQFSPFTILGSVDPLSTNLTLNLALSFKNLELTTFTAYMEKYGGYPLNKGKLMLDLQYDITHRKLVAANKVVIADLTLGAKNASPDAVHLPIKLGIALLEDRSGKINLDIPVTGSLDDPTFRAGPIFWKIVHNLMAKVVSSPFAMLGAILGGSTEELSYVDFQPGGADIAPAEQAKIEKLVKALYERPGLNLQIAGDASLAQDGPAIAFAHLIRRIKAARARELSKSGEPTGSVESIKLNSADYSRLIQDMYLRSLATNTQPVVATANSTAPPVVESALPGRHEQLRAGQAMMQHGADETEQANATAVASSAPIRPPDAPPVAPDVTKMEQHLVAQIPVTDSELFELMQARAHAVQTALLASGKVPADHLFVVAPQKTTNGHARVNFSLE
ncbi:MAG TPA: DUF748 domain-containing protein [Verrucomicrobiae bacterium]|nr:DUF748 domain-containing protein [Verrucomicrobiae bacterium]